MSGEKTGAEVFVKDKELAWLPARLLDQGGGKATVSVANYADELDIVQGGVGAQSWSDKTINLKDYAEFGGQLPLQNTKILDDMVDLPYLHEAAILYNVKARLGDALPYTRTGDIVIAVNPYTWLTHLYEEKEQLLYANVLVWEHHEQDPRKLVPPHVYEISALCYKGLAKDKINQSILVSGESGAGKTETVKIAMNHMASLQRGPVKSTGEAYSSPVVKKIVDSNPILEAFGNAKTRRNDNSSRFGKYINLQFARQGPSPDSNGVDLCNLAGSKCNVYLLEKTRIVGHDEVEGAYHIFYQILNSPDDVKSALWSGLAGKKCEDYKFVGRLNFVRKIDGMSDEENFQHLTESLKLVQVEGETYSTLFRAIVSVLVLGNIVFEEDPADDEKSRIKTKDICELVSDLVGIPGDVLEISMTERTMKTRNEEYKVPQKAPAAKDGCDSFAKEIYARSFLWLVREINSATSAEENYEGGGQTDFGIIGLLDIFGFESFPINGFEQLCINYCNEKLQQKFTKDIFQSVQEEYKYEGIDLDDIKYDDNSDVLDLIEGRGGLLAMLNEECVRPSGNDGAFVSKAISGNKKSKCLIAEMRMGPLEFGVHHYAGKVIYNANGFIGRNTDSLPVDLQKCAKTSSNDIIANHLENDAMTKTEVKKEEPKPTGKGPPRRGKSNLVSDTVWTKFKTQLNSLMTGLSLTSSRYIRCLKPNKFKKALKMQHLSTIDQLRCAGVVAAVTISRSAFPNKLDHEGCLDRFKMMKEAGSKEIPDVSEALVDLLDPVLKPREENGKKAYVIGKTKIYFRAGALEFLENERAKHLGKWAIYFQKVTRAYFVRKTLGSLRMKSKAPNALRIQQWFRCLVARKECKKRAKKKKMAGKKKKKQIKAAIKLQAIARGFIIRPKFQAKLKEKREKERLKNEVKDLEEKVREAEMRRMKEVEEAREAAEKEMEAYKAMIAEEKKADKEKQKKAAQQQTLIDESGKIIEYLRKENMKLRNQNDSMRKDFKSLKENNARLMEANASASASFTALNDHAKQLNATNAKLIKNVEAYKQQLEKLKEDLKTRQSYYLAEAEARLAYQKTMAQIVGTIQDKCRDAQLTEDVVIMALECEAEAKSERAALDTGSSKKAAAPAAAPAKKAPAKKAPPPDSDSDDDSDDDSDSD